MQASDTTGQVVDELTATILDTETTSDAVRLDACSAIGFQTPSSFTGTTITFLGSLDRGATFKQIRDQLGAVVAYTVAVDGSYPMDANTFAAYDEIKLVASAQTADIAILVKPFLI